MGPWGQEWMVRHSLLRGMMGGYSRFVGYKYTFGYETNLLHKNPPPPPIVVVKAVLPNETSPMLDLT